MTIWPTSATESFLDVAVDIVKAVLYVKLGTDNKKEEHDFQNISLSYLAQKKCMSTNRNIFSLDESAKESGIMNRHNVDSLIHYIRQKFLNMKRKQHGKVWVETSPYEFEFSKFHLGKYCLIIYHVDDSLTNIL